MASISDLATLHAIPLSTLPPCQVFRELDDESWYWVNTEGTRACPWMGSYLPSLPDEELQLRLTGSSGDQTLREGFRAYLLFLSSYRKYVSDLKPESIVLDFGCGWGRIIRYFLREVSPTGLYGVDVNGEAIEACTATNRWCTFQEVAPMPPLHLAPGSIDFIYLYSVFSHLAQEAHEAWVQEFARLLKPGGMLVATTWPREFILQCATWRGMKAYDSDWHAMAARAFDPADEWLELYEHGEFCFSHRGHDPPYFGEACVSQRYVEREWRRSFSVVDYIDDRSVCGQNVIVAIRE